MPRGTKESFDASAAGATARESAQASRTQARRRSIGRPGSTGRPGSAGRRPSNQAVDLEIKDVTIDDSTFDDKWARGYIWYQLTNELAMKSFCTIASSACEEDSLKQIHEDIKAAQFKFTNLPFTVRTGLLGDRGSAEIADLGEDYGQHDGDSLHKICKRLSKIVEEMTPFSFEAEMPYTARTSFEMLKCGAPSSNAANPLTREAAIKWTPRFQSTKLTCLCYLGPKDGKLSLRPHYSKNAQSILLRLMPGLIVFIRTDILEAVLTCPKDSVSLFTLCINETMWLPNTKQSPPTLELHEWIFDYLREYKMEMPEDFNPYQCDLPPEWQTTMNHNFYGCDICSLQGQSIKIPSAVEPWTWFGASMAGADVIEAIPYSRWNHDLYFDDGPESYRFHKTSCRHGGFCDGITLFDRMPFGINEAEAKSMAPHQRHVLEVGYEALHDAGYNKRTLMNSTGAHVCGFGSLQWNFVAKDDAGTYAATGEAAAIMAARLSFCFGMKGNCFVVDTEGSSGLTALNNVLEAIRVKGKQQEDAFGLASAVFLNLTPVLWPSQSAAGLLCPQGRCFTFEESANGYVQTDGVAGAVVRRMASIDDSDDHMIKDSDERHGIISAGVMNHNGASASLNAPKGPAEQELVLEALAKAHLYASDIDCVECHGAGAYLADAIEVGSMSRALRAGGGHWNTKEDPLSLLASKTGFGQMMHGAGLVSFIKGLVNARVAVMNPTLHMHLLNAHIDDEETPALINGETLNAKRTYGYFMGTMSRGFGGTNVFVVSHGVRNDVAAFNRSQEKKLLAEDRLLYWPGGGGEIPKDQVPQIGYYLMGSHNDWQNEQMQQWSADLFICPVKLDDDGVASFQITLDEDYARVLHPPLPSAAKDSPVVGPTPGELCHDYSWEIRGVAQAAYTVRLEICGAWRKVTWIPVEDLGETTKTNAADAE